MLPDFPVFAQHAAIIGGLVIGFASLVYKLIKWGLRIETEILSNHKCTRRLENKVTFLLKKILKDDYIEDNFESKSE